MELRDSIASFFSLQFSRPPQNIGEGVVSFVVDEDDGGEVDDFDLADGFHAEREDASNRRPVHPAPD